jgi:hypothetical protein
VSLELSPGLGDEDARPQPPCVSAGQAVDEGAGLGQRRRRRGVVADLVLGPGSIEQLPRLPQRILLDDPS